ncbi:MAG: hypothetical protein LH630_10750 [Actinomycetia bacterium]|nr:hypothetical protein [Actinomycetes bacterium]
MFLQVMQGKVRNRDLLDRQMDVWRTDFRQDAKGFLGATSGFTDDGEFVTLARFESVDAAQTNSQKPEQNAWWETFASAFDGELAFTDCTEVDTMMSGGSNDAGFVQIMRGRAVDPAKLRASAQAMEAELSSDRPDIIGGVVGWHGDREFVQAIYFISEDAARAGEKTMQDDSSAAEWEAMIDGPMAFADLHDLRFD